MAATRRTLGAVLLAFLLWAAPAFSVEPGWLDLNSEVVSLYRMQRYPEAVPRAEQVLALAESLYGEGHPYTSTSLNNLAALYHAVGRDEEAEPLYRRALAIETALFGASDPRVRIQRENLQESLRQLLPATAGAPDERETSDTELGWNPDDRGATGWMPPGEKQFPPPEDREEGRADARHFPGGAAGAAKNVEEAEPAGFWGWNGDFSARTGYRMDHLDWSIAGTLGGQDPNILSELTWDDLESYAVSAEGWLIRRPLVALRGSVDYGWIFQGDNQDSDYLLDNRRGEFSRSNNVSDEGHVLDASGGIGYPWEPVRGEPYEFRFTPLAGYSYHRQYLTITDGFQTIPATGSFGGLDSRYVTRWAGPWAGFDLTLKPYEKLRLHAGMEYHWASYLANARWNLRTDLGQPKSFRHTADGRGLVVETGLEYRISDRWELSLAWKLQDWATDPGIDKTFTSTGTTSDTRLNQVNWEAWSISLGGKYRF